MQSIPDNVDRAAMLFDLFLKTEAGTLEAEAINAQICALDNTDHDRWLTMLEEWARGLPTRDERIRALEDELRDVTMDLLMQTPRAK